MWNSLYAYRCKQSQVHNALHSIFTTQGYTPYNPFPGGSGTPANVTNLVRLFVAPQADDWVRILGNFPSAQLDTLAQQLEAPILVATADNTDARLEVIGEASIEAFLLAGLSLAEFKAALHAEGHDDDNLLVSDLSEQYGVDSTQAKRLVEKAAGAVMRKIGRQEGINPLMDTRRFSWNSQGGTRLRLGVACLRLPSDWAVPSFEDLAAAYQIGCLLEIDEDAPMLPGDEAVLDRVEYPLDFRPAYFAL